MEYLQNNLGPDIVIHDILTADTKASTNTPSAFNGAVVVKTGVNRTGEVSKKANELWFTPGVVSIPVVPTSKSQQTTQLLGLSFNDHNLYFACRDLQTVGKAGNIKPGETMIYAPGSAARTLYKLNGAIVNYTTVDNTDTGQGVSVYTGPDKIQLVYKTSSITMDDSGITLSVGGQSAITLTPEGIASLIGMIINCQGNLASFSGSVATMLGPNAVPTPGVAGAIYGPAGIVGVASSTVFISP